LQRKGESAKELDNAVCKNINPTGAMHQAVISNLAYIHNNGYDSWITEAEKQGARIYERSSREELENTVLQPKRSLK